MRECWGRLARSRGAVVLDAAGKHEMLDPVGRASYDDGHFVLGMDVVNLVEHSTLR